MTPTPRWRRLRWSAHAAHRPKGSRSHGRSPVAWRAPNVTVVSGLALGVDSAAHAGAVEVCGPTVAVLGGGADVPYPTRKAGLYKAILAAGGVVISEMPPGFRAFRWNFPARNRIIAALAPATIVVEAAERSGSLITAELALELGRDVAAVPGPVSSWRSRGTNALLRDGATLIRDVQDALELVLGTEGAAAALERAAEKTIAPPATLSARAARTAGRGRRRSRHHRVAGLRPRRRGHRQRRHHGPRAARPRPPHLGWPRAADHPSGGVMRVVTDAPGWWCR